MEIAIKKHIVEAAEAYMNEHGMSQNEFAEKAGINAAYLVQMRKGEYTIGSGAGKVTQIADKYFEMMATYMGFVIEKSYWETRLTDQMKLQLATLKDAKEHGLTSIVVGETGCGKTYVMRKFAKQNPIDMFVVTVGSCDSVGDIIDKIMDELKLPTAKTRSKKIKDICKHLRKQKLDGYKPMIVLDEAEYMKQPTLCAMKELYDNLINVCSIVMIGTDQLTRNIEKLRRRNKDGIPQLYRRIKFGIRQLPSIDRTYKDFLAGIQDKELLAFLRDNCDNYGELHDVLVPSMREADRLGQPLTVKLIRTILSLPNN